MKRLNAIFPNYLLYFALTFFAVGVTSCSNDDDVDDIITEPDPTGSITLGDQTLSGNTLIIENVTVGQDSWLVVRNAGEGTSTDYIADPMFLEAGSYDDVEIELNENANLTGDEAGDDIEVSLHVDDQNRGTPGTFDYDGQSGIDAPITSTTGEAVMENVNVRAPGLNIDDDQVVTENNEVTFNSVNLARDGWIVLYASNEDGTIDLTEIVGSRFVEAGEYTDLTVAFDDPDADFSGQTIHVRLHNDDPADQQFTFGSSGETEDLPEVYGFNTTTGEPQFVTNSAVTNTFGAFTVAERTGTGSGTGTGTGA